jgi:hypothetical protein
VRVVDGELEVANHLRRWGKREVVESLDHRQRLEQLRRERQRPVPIDVRLPSHKEIALSA